MRQFRQGATAQVEPRSTVVALFPVPDSDIGLTKALRAGHPDAVQALCDRYSGDLLRLAAAILGPDAMLESVVAEGIRRSLQTLGQLKEPRALRSWVMARLVVSIRQRLRTRRRWRWLLPKAQLDWSQDGRKYSEKLLACYRILESINELPRIVFCLAVIQVMDCSEIAAILGLRVSDVRKALDRACREFGRQSAGIQSICPRGLRSA